MDIFIEKEDKKVSRRFRGKVRRLLLELGINPETVIVVRNNEVITDEDIADDKDSIKILSVISGG